MPMPPRLSRAHLIPYAIITLNFVLFKLTRSLLNGLIAYYANKNQAASSKRPHVKLRGHWRLLKLFIEELLSTCELCADCAELNVVYERNGSLAYGASLFLLSYLWIDAFGEAHTTPGYLVEEYLLVRGNESLRAGDTYARLAGQSIAMSFAWRLASFYWQYRLLDEHAEILQVERCKSSLQSSTSVGFLVELACCLVCRLIELVGQRLLERNWLGQRAVGLLSSLVCTSLVVAALESSGGYFNPILAASLEFGCRGIDFYQHALVFWLAPLLGQVLARLVFRRAVERAADADKWTAGTPTRPSKAKRLTRSSSNLAGERRTKID